MRKQLIANIILAAVIVLIILIFIFEGQYVSQIPRTSWRFPRIIFTMVIVLGAAEILNNIRLLRKEVKNNPDRKDEPLFSNFKNYMAITIMFVLYGLLFYLFGFLISSIIFALAYGIYSKYPRRILFCVFTFITIPGIYFIFSRLLGVSFQPGIIIDFFRWYF